MSVTNTRTGLSFSSGCKCNVCGEKLWPPFIEWHGDSDIFICGRCCSKINRGLMADLIQCAAISDLQKLYGGFTLDRRSVKHLEDEEKKQFGIVEFRPK